MAAPQILFDESAALTALQQFITTAIPEVPQVDVYRARPTAAPGKWGLSVLIVPTTPLPVLQSYMGDQSTGKQQQLVRFVFAVPAAGAWRVRVLGQQTAAYVAGGGETNAQVRAIRILTRAGGAPAGGRHAAARTHRLPRRTGARRARAP